MDRKIHWDIFGCLGRGCACASRRPALFCLIALLVLSKPSSVPINCFSASCCGGHQILSLHRLTPRFFPSNKIQRVAFVGFRWRALVFVYLFIFIYLFFPGWCFLPRVVAHGCRRSPLVTISVVATTGGISKKIYSVSIRKFIRFHWVPAFVNWNWYWHNQYIFTKRKKDSMQI